MSIEVEIKSLLGSQEAADVLRHKLFNKKPAAKLLYKGKSINHYFITPADLQKFFKAVEKILPKNKFSRLKDIANKTEELSARTRETESGVFLVLKASVDTTTSANGTARIEFEEPVSLSLKKLDKLLLDCGFKYQAKWSRRREQYKYGDFTVCIDQNAGYGYLAEFELMVDNTIDTENAKRRLREELGNFGLAELNQGRLARMFDYYNRHWRGYYGTEKTFVIE